jgi:hypothetical protein
MFAETRRFMLPVVASLLLFSVGRAEEPQPFPTGVYSITINAREVPADAPADVRRALIAKYVLTFSASGRFKTVANGELDAAGRYASTATHLVITDETGPGHCKVTATGIYKWRLERDKLTLEAVDDGCKWRRFSITLKKWTKEK